MYINHYEHRWAGDRFGGGVSVANWSRRRRKSATGAEQAVNTVYREEEYRSIGVRKQRVGKKGPETDQ